MKSSPTHFLLKLTFILVLFFLFHLVVFYLFNIPLISNLIVFAYLTNYIITFLIYFFLYKYRIKLSHSLGFLFLGGSMIKFLFFFTLFLPFYKSDGIMSKLEFSTFYIPYAICLFLEVYYFVKLLKEQ